ncbi:mucin-20 [Loxodonta africana]|uniref:mucin-20 n=1 Tax=Loxodonta africana TaxID=9785 RepID=UPI0030D40C3C
MSAMTAGVKTSSGGAFWTTNVAETSGHLETQTLRTETSAGTFTPAGTTSKIETGDTKTISPATETKTLSKTIPNQFMAVITNAMETSATSGSTTVTAMTTVETVRGSDLTEAIFDTICTDDSSEEVKKVMVDTSTLAHTSAETGALTTKSSTSSDVSLPVIVTSPAPEPEITAPAKAWVAYTITDTEVTNCSIIEIEKTAAIPGLSDINHSPTRVKALSILETSALPDSIEPKSHITKTTISVKTLLTPSPAESATPGTTVEPPLTTTNAKERETTVEAATPNGTLVTVSTHSLEETAAFSAETISHTEVSEAVPISTEAESTTDQTTTPAMSSTIAHSPSEVATIKNSTPSETFTPESTTSRSFPISSGPLPSVNLTTANSSQGASMALAKTTASAKTLMIASTTRAKTPTATRTTAQTRLTTKGTAGPGTSRPGPLLTTNHIEMSAMTAGVKTSSGGAFWTTNVAETSGHLETQTLRTETSAGTFTPAGTTSKIETGDTKTISPATETKTLSKTIPNQFMAVITNAMETSATSGSTTVTAMTTVETVRGSDLTEAIFDTICTDDSSEEVKKVMVDTSTLAHTSAETGALTTKSSTSSDVSLPVIVTSPAPEPEITAPAKAWVAYTITDTEVTNCSIIEIEKTAAIPGLSDINHSPTRVKALSILETSALPDSIEPKSHITKTTISVKTLLTPSPAESATPGTTVEPPLTTTNTKERETTVEAATPNGTLVTVSTHSLEETAAFSAETISHTEVSEAVPISTEAESTTDQTTTPAMSSTIAHSPSEVATIKNSTPSETFTPESTTSRSFPISSGPLPSVNLTTANSSQGASMALAKTTASAKTLMIASTTRAKTPTATRTTAQTRLTTKGTAGGDGGFLLLRLSVASPEDLTDPQVAERLMKQVSGHFLGQGSRGE